MPVKLPDKPIEPTMFSPDRLLLYGMPKVGKTYELIGLQDHLILEGVPKDISMYRATWLPVTSYLQYRETLTAIEEGGAARMKEGKTGVDIYPYKFISIDTIVDFEEIAIRALTQEYIADQKKRPKDKQNADAFDPGFSIADLPHGAGWFLIRERVMNMYDGVSSRCKKTITIAQVKDKEITTMSNTLVKVTEINLSGKLAEIFCARQDAIGYVFRDAKGTLMVSFAAPTERTTMGARFKYLAGKTFPFSWEAIFPDEFGLPIPEK